MHKTLKLQMQNVKSFTGTEVQFKIAFKELWYGTLRHKYFLNASIMNILFSPHPLSREICNLAIVLSYRTSETAKKDIFFKELKGN